MEHLKFTGAEIYKNNILVYVPTLLLKRDYEWWALSTECTPESQVIINKEGHFDYKNPCDDTVSVVPVLKLANLDKTCYKVGDTFIANGLTFSIISTSRALCLNRIGTCSYRHLAISTANDFLNDWFNFYFKDYSVSDVMITNLYKVVHSPVDYRKFVIMNSNYDIKYNKYNDYYSYNTDYYDDDSPGFNTEIDALEVLCLVTTYRPIPQEDIDAYNYMYRIPYGFTPI